MRTELGKCINKYVLCKGWITDWEQINETTFRAYIEKPIIKKPNKDVLFDELETISREHHINLFLSYNSDVSGSPFKKYSCVSFAGCINQYKRKDGTMDYGVYPIAQSTLHQELVRMTDYIREIKEECSITSVDTLIHLEQNVKPYIMHLEEELINAGNLLPTFYGTYDFYESEIKGWKELVCHVCNLIRTIHSNRKMRRKCGLKKNLAINVPEFQFDNGVANMRKPLKCIHKKALKKGS